MNYQYKAKSPKEIEQIFIAAQKSGYSIILEGNDTTINELSLHYFINYPNIIVETQSKLVTGHSYPFRNYTKLNNLSEVLNLFPSNNMKQYQIYCKSPEISRAVLNYLYSMGYKDTSPWSEHDYQKYKWIVIIQDKRIGGNTTPDVNLKTINFNELFEIFSKKVEKVVLNEQYTAEVSADGIKVGCQNFSLDIVEKLVAAKAKIITSL